jgi:hypothetical protein
MWQCTFLGTDRAIRSLPYTTQALELGPPDSYIGTRLCRWADIANTQMAA